MQMNRIGRHAPAGHTTQNQRTEVLSEQRFAELLRRAGSFFADAEGHTEQERQAAIAEILSTMKRYGIRLADLA